MKADDLLVVEEDVQDLDLISWKSADVDADWKRRLSRGCSATVGLRRNLDSRC